MEATRAAALSRGQNHIRNRAAIPTYRFAPLVSGGKANKPKLFAPIALSGVIIGANMSPADRDVLFQILNERRAKTGLQPQTYQARVAGGIVRIDRAK